MTGLAVSKFGDWARAGIVLQNLRAKLYPAFEAQMFEDGDFVLKTIHGHIEAQDLPWTPLSEKTIKLKGNNTIYVETGVLKSQIKVRKVRSAANGLTLFIGASAWDKAANGLKASDLMIWMEYGNSRIPPRPLIRPTWDEVEPILKEHWRALIGDIVEGGA